MIREAVSRYFGLAPTPLATRAIDSFTDMPGLTEQLLAIQGLRSKAYTPPGLRDVLAIPAVFRAVTLISNTIGTFALEAFRNGGKMADAPAIVRRPDPFRTPRDFWRDSAWNLATRGECIWYIGARDSDGLALNLLNLPPAELIAEWKDPQDAITNEPSWKWRNVDVDRRNLVHVTFARESGAIRGIGPLQICGAALSVASEAEDWAANYFAGGGVPSILLSPRTPIDPADARLIKDAWMAGDPNTPKVASDVDATILSANPAQAQLAELRLESVGDVARMYGIPGDLLEYGRGGSSLTYKNLAEIGTDFVRFCLMPGYLEPMEQAVSDLLTRSTIARFDVDSLMRADIETRFRVYTAGIASGILDVPTAQRLEGLTPGNTDLSPVPARVPSVSLPAGVDR